MSSASVLGVASQVKESHVVA